MGKIRSSFIFNENEAIVIDLYDLQLINSPVGKGLNQLCLLDIPGVQLNSMFSPYLEEIITTFMELDPAARSRFEVILCYPGFHAVAIHRLASKFWKRKHSTLARFISHLGRMFTGIEIHPGATLGRRFIIDHGMGVVIGETAVVGDDCFIYQGVTLGAGSEARAGEETRGVKRHPTLGNGVVVGTGAVIQGDILVEDNATVASGSIVLKDVPANSIVVGVPGRVIYRDGKKVDSRDGKRNESKIPDIEAEAIKRLKNRLDSLEGKLASMRASEGGDDSKDDDKSNLESPEDGASRDDSDPVDVFLQGAGI